MCKSYIQKGKVNGCVNFNAISIYGAEAIKSGVARGCSLLAGIGQSGGSWWRDSRTLQNLANSLTDT